MKVNAKGDKPPARVDHVWITLPGTKTILYGGEDENGIPLDENIVYHYDYYENRWYANEFSDDDPHPISRRSPCYWRSPRGIDKFILFGGKGGYTDFWEYTYTTNKWEQITPQGNNIILSSMDGFVCSTSGDNNVMYIIDVSNDRMYMYDMLDESIYLVDGLTSYSHMHSLVNGVGIPYLVAFDRNIETIWSFKPTTEEWAVLQSNGANDIPQYPAIVQRSANSLLLYGGLNKTTHNPSSKLFSYDLETQSISLVPIRKGVPPPLVHHRMTKVRGKFLLTGGFISVTNKILNDDIWMLVDNKQ